MKLTHPERVLWPEDGITKVGRLNGSNTTDIPTA